MSPPKVPHSVHDEDPIRREGSAMQYRNFDNEAWKKSFVLAVLEFIHKKENLELACHSIYSVDSLRHELDTQVLDQVVGLWLSLRHVERIDRQKRHGTRLPGRIRKTREPRNKKQSHLCKFLIPPLQNNNT